MSLLFDHALSNFSPVGGHHYEVTADDFASAKERVPVKPIVEFAQHHDLAFPGDDEYISIPLHGTDNATPTGEYLGYANTDLRGEIIVYRDGDDRGSISLSEFAETKLARRVRFWHSDYQPPSLPESYDRPVDDNEPSRKTIDSNSFCADLEEYIGNERDATRQANEGRAQSNTAREIYVNGGNAIPTVEYRGQDGEQLRLEAQPLTDESDDRDDWAYYVPNTFGIYQGNEILLHGDGDVFPLPATVETIHGLRFTASIHWSDVESSNSVRHHLSNDADLGISLLLNTVPTDRELEAVAELQKDAFLDVLTGQRPITFTNGATAQSMQADDDLNQEQQLASELALLADDVFCIHGPPGTGKTRTLIEIVRRAVEAGERVLVCADSNQAVDNIVVGESTVNDPDDSSLHRYAQYENGEFTLRRLNGSKRSNDLVRQYGTTNESADVVAGTNNSTAGLPSEFDLLVLDEATQATCASSCIPLVKADRVVLAGDHKQLPPFSTTEEPPESSLGMSLFEHLYADGGVYEGVGMQLKTQYRMHRDIAAFSNSAFYNRELRNGRTVESLPSRDEPMEAFNVGGSVEVDDYSRSNDTEARLVTYLVQELSDDLSTDEIGVITPYTAQVRTIEERLQDHIQNGNAVTVDTIDSFQGSEREAIVLSLVRSNSHGNIGFLGREKDGPRRLNVALTRAKRYCAVVADFHTLCYETSGKCTDLYARFNRFFEETDRRRDVDPDFIPI
ncbi:DEAD/DEAH box helicase [Natrialba swarupiae]|uniref:AAA family ATPase n=1 Tax=Natrialba swarupiae TaxID=2448032 RepID=A0A5D5AKN2_9EURY|nr:AAA domain-containing protein [Natrialba swarupiae]TYT62256.1 AAA family ATPase [Natrialba swarupiae]